MSDQHALRLGASAARFFDWASLSPLCMGAVKAQRRHLEHVAAVDDPPLAMRASTAFAALRLHARSLVNGDGRHDVVLGRSASELLSTLAHGLGIDRDRDQIVLCEPNHPCLPLAYRSAAASRSLGVRSVKALPSREIDLDALERTLDERCAVVAMTHVDHLHGVVQPLDAVTRLAHAVGARVIVDGAQAVGRIPIDITEADAYIGVGRKALLSPIGTAFLVAKRDLLEQTSPLIWSTRSAHLDESGNAVPASSPTHLEGNLPDVGALAGLEASIRAFDPPTVHALQSHVACHLPTLAGGLLELGVPPSTYISAGNAGIASFTLSNANGTQLQHNLRQAGFVVAASDHEFRVSLHFANSADAIHQLIEEVRHLV